MIPTEKSGQNKKIIHKFTGAITKTAGIVGRSMGPNNGLGIIQKGYKEIHEIALMAKDDYKKEKAFLLTGACPARSCGRALPKVSPAKRLKVPLRSIGKMVVFTEDISILT